MIIQKIKNKLKTFIESENFNKGLPKLMILSTILFIPVLVASGIVLFPKIFKEPALEGDSISASDDNDSPTWQYPQSELFKSSFLVGTDFRIKIEFTDNLKFNVEDVSNVFEEFCQVDERTFVVFCNNFSLKDQAENIEVNFESGKSPSQFLEQFNQPGTLNAEASDEQIKVFVNSKQKLFNLILIKDKQAERELATCIDELKICFRAKTLSLEYLSQFTNGYGNFKSVLSDLLENINILTSTSEESLEFKTKAEQELLHSTFSNLEFEIGNKTYVLPEGYVASDKTTLPGNKDLPNGFCGVSNQLSEYSSECEIVKIENKTNKNIKFYFTNPRQYNVLRDQALCYDVEHRQISVVNDTNSFQLFFSGESFYVPTLDEATCPEVPKVADNFENIAGCFKNNTCLFSVGVNLEEVFNFLNNLTEK